MRVLTEGIAHVSFSGGGMFLPARNPYDRQLLAEHIINRVRAKGQVQVLVDGQRWMIHLNRRPSTATCIACGGSLHSACYSLARGEVAYCVRCALGTETAPYSTQREAQRDVG